MLTDEVSPHEPLRQWVLDFPYLLRFLFASRSKIMGLVLGIVYRVSLHAGVATKVHERRTLERLCRYISRPALSK